MTNRLLQGATGRAECPPRATDSIYSAPDLRRVGDCVCGRPVAEHFDVRNRFQSCVELSPAVDRTPLHAEYAGFLFPSVQVIR